MKCDNWNERKTRFIELDDDWVVWLTWSISDSYNLLLLRLRRWSFRASSVISRMHERWSWVLYHRSRSCTLLNCVSLRSKLLNEEYYSHRIERGCLRIHSSKHRFLSLFCDLSYSDEERHQKWRFLSRFRMLFNIFEIKQRLHSFWKDELVRQLSCYSHRWIFYRSSRILENFERSWRWLVSIN